MCDVAYCLACCLAFTYPHHGVLIRGLCSPRGSAGLDTPARAGGGHAEAAGRPTRAGPGEPGAAAVGRAQPWLSRRTASTGGASRDPGGRRTASVVSGPMGGGAQAGRTPARGRRSATLGGWCAECVAPLGLHAG